MNVSTKDLDIETLFLITLVIFVTAIIFLTLDDQCYQPPEDKPRPPTLAWDRGPEPWLTILPLCNKNH